MSGNQLSVKYDKRLGINVNPRLKNSDDLNLLRAFLAKLRQRQGDSGKEHPEGHCL